MNRELFLEHDCNLLEKNLLSIFDATQMKRNSYIAKLHEDIVEVFAHLFLDGNKKKALAILEAEKEITQSQFMWISMFTGGSITQVLTILFFVFYF